MPEINKYEKQFFNALCDIFIGAKVEGDSGYVNLMRIKYRYYTNGVFPQLQKDITEALQPFPDFREELFDKLYTFFQRYFSESGSIYFRYTALHQNIYEKVYTDDRDVILFWKTHMLYYVKTDRIFTSLNVEVDGTKFFFDASKMTLKKSNEKREVVYAFRKIQPEDGTLVFDVSYSERGNKTKFDDILKEIKQADGNVDDETLNKAFRVFEKQSEVDFFINKNARAFLQEQFDLWMYQYLFEGQNIWSAERLAQLQALKAIAYNVIDFISQFEDELVKIWNKPKFVRNSHYVITLDRIAQKNTDLLVKVINHIGIKQQIVEWQEMGFVNSDFKPQYILKTDHQLVNKYQHLPVDTRFFQDIEIEIISNFDNLDSCLDGWLIYSENFQALSSLSEKFKGKLESIYIDPPFNLENNGDFMYYVNYKNSIWLSLLENRVRLANKFISDSGNFFIRCDYNGNMLVRLLFDEIFGAENFSSEIIINRFKRQLQGLTKFNVANDSLFLYTKSSSSIFNELTRSRICSFCGQEKDPEWHLMISSGLRKPPERVILGKLMYPPKGQHWKYTQEKINGMEEQGRIRIDENKSYTDINGNRVKGVPEFLQTEDAIIDNDWTDLKGYVLSARFPTENAEELLSRVIKVSSNHKGLIADFFLGSGTTTAVAHKLGRRWIGIEQAEQFYSVVLPRMKKVLSGEQTGISKDENWKGGGFFKYFEIEQYEDVLRRAHYTNADLFDNPYEDPYHRYIFMRDLKMLDSIEIDPDQNKVHFHPERLYPDIDMAETLSQRRGKWIKRITKEYVEFQDGERMSLTDSDWQTIKPLIWWQ